jgi:hydroxymethylbilane synthase
MSGRPIFIATRGSALALAQANAVLAACRKKFPNLQFELKIIKSTGDKLQTASMSKPDVSLPKGLFTKELEVALLEKKADLAVHSLKDLPTDLPDGLMLGGVAGKREDVRDVLVYRDNFKPKTKLLEFPQGLTIATSSTRRKAQILALRPDFKAVEIRGNVPTRLEKTAAQKDFDLTLLAFAGLSRLHYDLGASGILGGGEAPKGLHFTILDTSEVLPCVGQGAIGLEIRQGDGETSEICARLNDLETFQSVTAERAMLKAMGGGCQTPVGAHGRVEKGKLVLTALSFVGATPRRAEARTELRDAQALGEKVASQLA